MENKRRTRRGFTLMEIMVVVVILGILATVVTLKVSQYLSKAKVKTAKIQMQEIMKGLALYKMEHKNYPENLEELLEKTEENPEGLLPSIPFDPWGNDYEYVSDTDHGYDLVSYGADGQEGGEGEDADINSWELAGGTTQDEVEGGEGSTSSSSEEGE
ncbi:MAG: type II secretion system major pseudopilin GspG [Planctomycetota bacterium]|jgi:general secretion pathway protein G